MKSRGLLVATALVACSPPHASQGALFGPESVAQPFGDGAIIRWLDEDQGGAFQFQARLAGLGYELWVADRIEHIVEFVPITTTPEEDYVVQRLIPSEDEPGFIYFFLWREAEGYRARRVWAQSRGELMQIYRRDVYPHVQQSR
jgi:hypothetical protein